MDRITIALAGAEEQDLFVFVFVDFLDSVHDLIAFVEPVSRDVMPAM
jgi:hypothetical protein